MATAQLLFVASTLLATQRTATAVEASTTTAGIQQPPADAVFGEGFLDSEDLEDLGLRRSHANMDVVEDDASFVAAGGSRKGAIVWTATGPDSAIDTLVDVRWAFPSSADAAAFLATDSEVISDGLPALERDVGVGVEGRLHGQSSTPHEVGGARHVLAFRVDRIVVKIYVQAGAGSPDPDLLLTLGERAARRLPGPESTEPEPIESKPPSEPVRQTGETTPEPTPPKAPRSEDRRRVSPREYWSRGPFAPSLHPGWAFSAPIGRFEWRGHPIRQRMGWSLELAALIRPRVHLRAQLHRERWRGPPGFNVITRRLEFIYGLDVLALPQSWKVRPALLGIGGVGFGWSYAGLPDDPETLHQASGDTGVGLGLVFGGEAGLHFRLSSRVDIAVRGGAMRAFYAYTDDHAAGAKGYPRAWRWHAGISLGFVLPPRKPKRAATN